MRVTYHLSLFCLMSVIITPDLIPAKLRDGEIVLQDLAGSDFKSQVWKDIGFLNYPSGEYSGYVWCKLCKTALKHDRTTSGTSHLSNHLRRCQKNIMNKTSKPGYDLQPKISGFIPGITTLPKAVKDKLCEASLAFVVEDLRPFSVMEGSGFLKLANALIEVGAIRGKLNAESALPSTSTVRRKLESRAKEARLQLVDNVKTALSENGMIGVTSDMWTDLKTRHFLGVTVHFMHEQKIFCHILTVSEFQEQKKTGENLRRSIDSICRTLDYPMEMFVKKAVFVTDQGSNIKAALSCYHRIPCACHMLATTLRHTLQLETSSSLHPISEADHMFVFVQQVRRNVEKIKRVTTYFKRTGKNNKLTFGLRQSNETRWNSVLTMLRSYKRAQDEVERILCEAGEDERIHGIDIVVVNNLINFLTPFEEASTFLEGASYPTIHRVYLWYKKLERFLTPLSTDSQLLTFLKQRGAKCLAEKFEISDIHLIGLLLHPKFKALVPLSLAQREDVIRNTERMLVVCLPVTQERCDHNYLPPKKKQTPHIESEFLEWQEIDEENCDLSSEVRAYVSQSLESIILDAYSDEEFSIVKFWCCSEVKAKYPRLSRLSLGILSVPASSAASERAFSCCGNVLTKKRAQLTSSALDQILLLNSMKGGH